MNTCQVVIRIHVVAPAVLVLDAAACIPIDRYLGTRMPVRLLCFTGIIALTRTQERQ